MPSIFIWVVYGYLPKTHILSHNLMILWIKYLAEMLDYVILKLSRVERVLGLEQNQLIPFEP